MSDNIYNSVMKAFSGKQSRKRVLGVLSSMADDTGGFTVDRQELADAAGLHTVELDGALGDLVRDRWISMLTGVRAPVLMGSVRK